ncbi:hypothetical protein SAMN05660860_02246 [Geoalkalibacter ferrihydriticus]|uniref:Lipoprotein n=2 Tax=Geoalkalibacter ferrihydriticus TaxID=392333 RepID=A0A0C2DX96_9BACT|nr:hypothetical protein [Geoalkalibacter ferrihydriticus]KIH78069.1 hypothetical protein GFER_05640 [Geoalkalibacter ferrihydriticus DSM 17813]SDM30763.1 hypothetical protein SAMN05660860_02246 [Geoalkalibacter ferrihydriticus]
MKKSCLLLVLAFFTLSLACTERQDVAPEQVLEETENIRQVAMFEDQQGSRIVAFEFAPGVSAEKIRDHAESLRHVEGRLLGAYFFEEGSRSIPPNILRRSLAIMNAVDLLYDTPEVDKWHFAFMRPFAGESRFVDCVENPQDALCRKGD